MPLCFLDPDLGLGQLLLIPVLDFLAALVVLGSRARNRVGMMQFFLLLRLEKGNLVGLLLLVLPGPENVQEIGQLKDQHERHGDHDNHRPAAALVHHERGEPTLELVSKRRDHEQERRRQGQLQEHDRASGKDQPENQAQYGRHEDEQGQAEQGAQVIDQKHAGERHRQIQELIQRQHFRALQLC